MEIFLISVCPCISFACLPTTTALCCLPAAPGWDVRAPVCLLPPNFNHSLSLILVKTAAYTIHHLTDLLRRWSYQNIDI